MKRVFPEIQEDVMFTNLKLELIAEKAKNAMLEGYLSDMRINNKIYKKFTNEEIIQCLQSISMERDKRHMNETELNICISMIRGDENATD